MGKNLLIYWRFEPLILILATINSPEIVFEVMTSNSVALNESRTIFWWYRYNTKIIKGCGI